MQRQKRHTHTHFNPSLQRLYQQSTAQRSTTVQTLYSTIQRYVPPGQHNTKQYNTTLHKRKHSTAQHNTTQRRTTQNYTTQRNTTLRNTNHIIHVPT